MIASTRLLVRTVLLATLRPRRFHALGVGTGKTGTTSLAAMFKPRFRARHEPGVRQLGPLILAKAEGRLTRREEQRALSWHARRYWLEMESSQLLGFFLPTLVSLFPEARFICTWRPARSWLRSVLIHETTRPSSPIWRQIAAVRYRSGQFEHRREDAALTRRGRHPLAAYLDHWRGHHEQVVTVVPAQRRLFVPTSAIGDSAEALAAFLSISPSDIDTSRAHLNRSVETRDPLAELDPAYLADHLERYCGALEARLAELSGTVHS